MLLGELSKDGSGGGGEGLLRPFRLPAVNTGEGVGSSGEEGEAGAVDSAVAGGAIDAIRWGDRYLGEAVGADFGRLDAGDAIGVEEDDVQLAG
ncbi:hypothetical protein MRB53_020372 [Persea americana]|uniref:Uncharacterized protein n=1 Tax=Persea americana TaxID=3435 RepID=A0ACC2L1B0_PERAE|nr:hypothetical protein MRB53_020372 [Persea americana]